MIEEHWFDALNKALVQEAPRRMVLRQAVALAISLDIAVDSAAVAKKPKQKHKKDRRQRKDKQKKKHDVKPPLPQSCSGGACAQEWAGNQAEIDYCEFICRQCDGQDPRQFCIAEGEPTDPAKVAFCCAEGRECCGNQCCGDPAIPEIECCGDRCVNTKSDESHCGRCDNDCANAFPFLDNPGAMCCSGSCEATTDSQYDCGGCNQRCNPDDGKQCCNGSCIDIAKFDNAHCGSCAPCPTGKECCFGRCIDPQIYACCRNHPRPLGICSKPLVCCTRPDGQPGCCQS